MFKNPRRGRQARNCATNVPKILDLKSSSEQIFSENWRWVPLTTQLMGRPAPLSSWPLPYQRWNVIYSTEKFFTVLRRFVSLRGYLRKLISGNGTQLTAANEKLRKVSVLILGLIGTSWPRSMQCKFQNGTSEAEVHEESNYGSSRRKRGYLLWAANSYEEVTLAN